MEVNLDGQSQTLYGIYVGHVYLVAGQSNVQFKMQEDTSYIHTTWLDPMLRSFFVARLEGNEHFSPADGWVECTPETIPYWSAIGCLTGRKLRETTGEAVGMVCCYQGASGILSWLPEGSVTDFCRTQLFQDYTSDLYAGWNKDGILYHAMFERLLPFSFSGVIWYQGESDTSVGEAKVYASWLCSMVNRWRADLRDSSLFFAIIQIADYAPRANDPAWAMLQQEQAKAAAMLDACTLVISRDVCASDDIHPPKKALLSERIAHCLMDAL